MSHNNVRYLFGTLLAVLIAFSLTACGSGGGGGGSSSSNSTPVSPTLSVSGVAASGAPLVGGSIFIKDANGIEHGPYPINPDGSYSVNVSGFNNPPFYLRAEGTINGESVTLYSVSMNPGTANINPLTNLAVAAAAGVDDPAEVYEDPVIHPVTEDKLNDAINDILIFLGPILSNGANKNFLTDDYVADPEQDELDKFFEDVDIETVSGSVSFILNGVELGELRIFNLEVINEIEAGESSVALSSSLVSGSGWISGSSLSLQVGGSRLQYSDILEDIDFESTSITAVEVTGVAATITGEGKFNGVSGYAFTAAVTDGTPDAMGIEIRNGEGAVIYSSSSQNITGGDLRINDSHNAVFGVGTAAGKSLTLYAGGNWYEYANLLEEIDFESTSITDLGVSGTTATITGEGKLNGVPGYTFTAAVTDNAPDAMGMEIRNGGGTVIYNSPSQNITSGDFRVIE
jgi:hypothetical protein